MFSILSTIENTIGAFESALSLLANKAANTGTAGYKEPEYHFRTLFSMEFHGQSAVGSGLRRARGGSSKNIGTGSELVLMGHNMKQGAPRTGSQYDAMVQGSGFFVTENAINQKKTLTRNGNFTIAKSFK